MSEKLTRITIPGHAGGGIMDWGEKSASEMVGQIRRHADRLRADVAAIDAASDGDFQIDVVLGSCVQHHVREVQRSALKKEAAVND